jgi:hypothetical protein
MLIQSQREEVDRTMKFADVNVTSDASPEVPEFDESDSSVLDSENYFQSPFQ